MENPFVIPRTRRAYLYLVTFLAIVVGRARGTSAAVAFMQVVVSRGRVAPALRTGNRIVVGRGRVALALDAKVYLSPRYV